MKYLKFTKKYPECLIDEVSHLSDCAVHNMPAYPNGNCNCSPFVTTKEGFRQSINDGDYVVYEDDDRYVINGDFFNKHFIKADNHETN